MARRDRAEVNVWGLRDWNSSCRMVTYSCVMVADIPGGIKQECNPREHRTLYDAIWIIFSDAIGEQCPNFLYIEAGSNKRAPHSLLSGRVANGRWRCFRGCVCDHVPPGSRSLRHCPRLLLHGSWEREVTPTNTPTINRTFFLRHCFFSLFSPADLVWRLTDTISHRFPSGKHCRFSSAWFSRREKSRMKNEFVK